jgi:phenylacetate-CoA ligase
MRLTQSAFWLKERVTGRQTAVTLAELQASQWWTSAAMQAHQWTALTEMVRYAAAHVPWYRDRYAAAGWTPDRLQSLEDFAALPFLEKADIREHWQALIAEEADEPVMLKATSGSTGMSLVIPSGRSATQRLIANWARSWEWWGLAPGEPHLRIWGVNWHFHASWKRRLAARLKWVQDLCVGTYLVSAFDTDDQTLRDRVALLARRRPRLIFGYGVAIYVLAEFIHRHGLSLGYRPQAIIYTSETLHPTERQLIEATFGCKTVAEYGAVEVGTIAYECSEGNLHVCDESIYLEVVNAQGRPVIDEEGEVVVTQLVTRATPIIRYRLGDLAIAAPRAFQCPCGRGLSVIRALRGRKNSVLTSPSGVPVHPEVFDYIMRAQAGNRRYRVIEQARGHLHILLERTSPLEAAMEARLQALLQEHVGADFTFTLECVPLIPNEASGKFRWIVPLPEATKEGEG